MARFHSFLLLSNILLYVCVTSILAIRVIDGHPGYFHILAIVNNAAMNIRVHDLFELVFSFFKDKDPEVELQGHVVIVFLIF